MTISDDPRTAVDVQRHSELSQREAREPRWETEPPDEVRWLQLGNVLLRRWKLLVVVPFLMSVIMAVISLQLQPRYQAHATFVPEMSPERVNLPGALAGLAVRFGLSVPNTGSSPYFYADVLRSRTMADQVLRATFANPGIDDLPEQSTLLEILRVEGASESQRLERGRRQLQNILAVEPDLRTNIVTVSVTTSHRTLSADVANYLVDLLSQFNTEVWQSNARERREFIERRVDETAAELRESEERLKSFLEGNRQFRGSPELEFQHDRLQRQVTIKQEVYTTLLREFEEARIQEVDDTPAITVIDRAVPPDRRASPQRKRLVMVTFVITAFAAVFLALLLETLARARHQYPDQVAQMRAQWFSIKRTLRGPFRRRSD